MRPTNTGTERQSWSCRFTQPARADSGGHHPGYPHLRPAGADPDAGICADADSAGVRSYTDCRTDPDTGPNTGTDRNPDADPTAVGLSGRAGTRRGHFAAIPHRPQPGAGYAGS